MEPSVVTLLTQLDAWRELPAYRLEPRVDALAALFLRGLLQTRVSRLHEIVIPELPLRRGMLWDEGVPGRNKSKKVDFALFSPEARTVYFVEFKTDMMSRNAPQDGYLARCGEKHFSEILAGIAAIRKASAPQYRGKYNALQRYLAEWGFGLDDEGIQRGAEVAVCTYYLQPSSPDPKPANVFDFSEFADFMQTSGGDLGSALAPFFRRWSVGPG